MVACRAPVSEAILVDYWTGDLADGEEFDGVERHLFECGECSGRLAELAAFGAGVTALARAGRINGVISRALLNRLQRDGVRIRMYSLVPGESVPCAVFPGDELVVADLRADLTGASAVTLSLTGPDNAPFSRYEDVPVASASGEVLLATPAALLQQIPSMRLEVALTSAGEAPVELGRYALEHTAHAPRGTTSR
jgi:hypothetical protein